jgi:hypothetical protein
MKTHRRLSLFILFSLLSSASFGAGLPACKDKKKNLEINSDMLLNYRDQMEAKFKTRGYAKGVLVRVMEDRQGHVHLEMDFDENLQTADDRVEVVYNTEFGALPDARPGDQLVVCGDFIVDPYSPLKAVIHWLHFSPKKQAHDDGFLAINGVVYGLGNDL